MTALTTRQRDILRLLLDAQAPLAAGELAQKMHLTPRQVSYGLRGLKQWLAQQALARATAAEVRALGAASENKERTT
jgi:mannitol operon transcriptional antiterminator